MRETLAAKICAVPNTAAFQNVKAKRLACASRLKDNGARPWKGELWPGYKATPASEAR